MHRFRRLRSQKRRRPSGEAASKAKALFCNAANRSIRAAGEISAGRNRGDEESLGWLIMFSTAGAPTFKLTVCISKTGVNVSVP